MGLSNEERLTKMYWGVHNLATTIRKLRPQRGEDLYPDEDKWDYLLGLGEKVWHTLLAGSKNGTYWILGGALTSPVGGPTSPWAVLISAQCDDVRQERQERQWEGQRDIHDVCADPFDVYLNLRSLVERTDSSRGGRRVLLLDAYNFAEFLIYGLRRYDDEFRRGFPELDKLISDVLGACFALMYEDTAFGKAYVGERMLRAIYGQWDGPLWHSLNAVHMQFGMASFMRSDVPLADVVALDRWRIDHKDTPQNRLVLALRIAGPYMYEEVHEETLIKKTRGLNIREAAIRREFAKNRKAHERREAERKVREENGETRSMEENSVVHGYDYDWGR